MLSRTLACIAYSIDAAHPYHRVVQPGRRKEKKMRKMAIMFGLGVMLSIFVAGGVALAATITGTARDETLIGTAYADTIGARGGDDVLRGLGGPDQLYGNGSRDEV